MTVFLSPLLCCVPRIPHPHYKWSNAPVTQAALVFILLWFTCYVQKHQINTFPHHTEGHTHTSTHYSKCSVPMLQACDKSPSQFHSICHQSQLPTKPRVLVLMARGYDKQLWFSQATIVCCNKTIIIRVMSMDCITFLSSLYSFLWDLKVFDHIMLVCSFRLLIFSTSQMWNV